MGKVQQCSISVMKQKIKKKKKVGAKLKKGIWSRFDGKQMFKRAKLTNGSLKHITINRKLKKNLLLKEHTVTQNMRVENIEKKKTVKKKNVKQKKKKKHDNGFVIHDAPLEQAVIEKGHLLFSQLLKSSPMTTPPELHIDGTFLSKILNYADSVRPTQAMEMSSHTSIATIDSTPVASNPNIPTAFCKNSMEAEKLVRDTSVEMHLVSNSKYIFVMKHPCCLFIRGKLRIKVILGLVEVLGCNLKEGSGSKLVYSPRGSSQLSLLSRPCEHVRSQDWENLHTKLEELGMDIHDVESIVAGLKKNDCLLLAEEVSSALSSYVNAQFGFQVFPNIQSLNVTRRFHKAEKHLQCHFELPSTQPKDKLYRKGLNWDSLAEDIISSRSAKGYTSTVACGGKGVGKSTLLRFLVNRTLAVCDQVLFLDFDPGQAEFTVPGCVSAVIVKEPLLGPNYTHHQVPERMVFIGDVDVSRCPSIYIRCVHHIIDYCQSRPELMTMPWFINTMGFTKGLGVELIVALIRFLKPNHVVQIESCAYQRNFPNILHAAYVKAYQGSMNKSFNDDLNYSICSSSSVAERRFQPGLKDDAEWGFRARQLREIMILSYLSQVVNPPSYSLADIVPYVTSFSQLRLCVCHESVHFSHILSVINGNLVALCSTDDQNVIIPEDPEFPAVFLHLPISPCLGFGIVRGIDLEEKLLFVISPLSDSEMARVNCLVMGSISLPERVYVAPLGVKGQIPYVVSGQCQQTARTPRQVNQMR